MQIKSSTELQTKPQRGTIPLQQSGGGEVTMKENNAKTEACHYTCKVIPIQQ